MREITEYQCIDKPKIGDLVWHYYLCSLNGPYVIVDYDVEDQWWVLSDTKKFVGARTHSLRRPAQRWLDD